MNGRIDSEGGLHIYRNGRDVTQFCLNGPTGCTHHCPQFGTPEASSWGDMVLLEICQRRVLQFSTFVDERKSE